MIQKQHDKLHTVGLVCLAMISSALMQCIVVGFLGVLFIITAFTSGLLIWHLSNDAQLGLKAAPLFSIGLVMLTYALVWLGYWSFQAQNGIIRMFYLQMVCAMLPLVSLLFLFDPTPYDPTGMIIVDEPKEFYFSCLLCSIFLFPLYSIGIRKFVITSQSWTQGRNLVLLWGVLVLVGSPVFYVGWNYMNQIYQM